jgi:hypothetical protein
MTTRIYQVYQIYPDSNYMKKRLVRAVSAAAAMRHVALHIIDACVPSQEELAALIQADVKIEDAVVLRSNRKRAPEVDSRQMQIDLPVKMENENVRN